ncbi:MAG TPA: hypothetical protein VL500_06680 [Candidatus Eisenbacteria bacterium]|nr:hypothetical protein [Candidatus Eisenbacteria bacterium]
MDITLLEKRAEQVLARFDPGKLRAARQHRPFMIEFFGTPKSGKSTMKEMLRHFFDRNKYRVYAATEGAEAIRWRPRVEPDYNLRTAEYALGEARDLCFQKSFHVGIFDRAVFDGIMRMDYYREKGVISPQEHAILEGYYLLPHNRKNLFDLHVCLVASPEVSIERELARALTKKHGETMNPATISGLLDAHKRIWDRLGCADDPSMLWHDSSAETEAETAASILQKALEVFEKRVDSLPPL